MGCTGLRGSEITLYGELPSTQQTDKPCDRLQSRTKVKTNGHFTPLMQVKNNLSNEFLFI